MVYTSSVSLLRFLLLAAMTCGTALADSIVSSPSGLGAPGATLTFDEIVLADNTILTVQYSSQGIQFSGFVYNGCPGCPTAPPEGTKPDITNFANSDTSTFFPLSAMVFDFPVSGAAFNFASNVGTFTFTAKLGSATVEQFTVNIASSTINGVNGWGWYGFENTLFDAIEIQAGAAFLADHLQYASDTAPVPEPATLILAGSGLAGAWFRRRRQRS
jgi:hypothetical protein